MMRIRGIRDWNLSTNMKARLKDGYFNDAPWVCGGGGPLKRRVFSKPPPIEAMDHAFGQLCRDVIHLSRVMQPPTYSLGAPFTFLDCIRSILDSNDDFRTLSRGSATRTPRMLSWIAQSYPQRPAGCLLPILPIRYENSYRFDLDTLCQLQTFLSQETCCKIRPAYLEM